jgi:hypothetical protein
LTGNYFKQDTSKSSNPELNDAVKEDNDGGLVAINGNKCTQVMGQNT